MTWNEVIVIMLSKKCIAYVYSSEFYKIKLWLHNSYHARVGNQALFRDIHFLMSDFCKNTLWTTGHINSPSTVIPGEILNDMMTFKHDTMILSKINSARVNSEMFPYLLTAYIQSSHSCPQSFGCNWHCRSVDIPWPGVTGSIRGWLSGWAGCSSSIFRGSIQVWAQRCLGHEVGQWQSRPFCHDGEDQDVCV